ncbi:MAG: hypothetical protein QXT31_06970 [Candidatus Bathyarchaeia archaeon]
MSVKLENYSQVFIREFKVVIDLEDFFNPEMMVEDFIRIYNKNPTPPRYRIVTLEIATCPEDNQPVLITECGKCPKFIKRIGDYIFCKKHLTF